MRVVLTTLGCAGYIGPFLALAVELRRAGHKPVLALSPSFEHWVRETGVEFVAIGPSVPSDLILGSTPAQRVDIKDDVAYRFQKFALDSLSKTYHDLRNTCHGADVLIGSPSQLACHMVRDSLLIPYISVHPSQFGDDLKSGELHGPSASLINPYRVREGLAPIDVLSKTEWNAGTLSLYAVSKHVLERPVHWSQRNKIPGFFFLDEQGWRPETRLEEFCASGDPPVVIALEDIEYSNPAITELALGAVRQLACRTIIQHNWNEMTPPVVEDCVYVTTRVPQFWLFSRAALVVHSGDASTAAIAFRAGVPTVVVPRTSHQHVWAEFSKAKGCTKYVVPLSQLSPARLTAAIRSTLALPQIVQASAALGEQVRLEDGVETARMLVEELVSEHHRFDGSSGDCSHWNRQDLHPARLVRRARKGPIPLSYSQQRLWFLAQLEPASVAYNLPFALRVSGDLDRCALQRALNEVVKRHEVLRTSFRVREGQPVQELAAALDLTIEEVDLRYVPTEDREHEAKKHCMREAATPFNLAQEPLLRLKLLQLTDGECVLLVNMHHIVTDGWSVAIMVREISRFYEAHIKGEDPGLPELPIQYSDFAIWQREWLQGEILTKELGHWRKCLAEVPTLEPTTDRPRPKQMNYKGGKAKFVVPSEMVDKLKELGRREGATLFMILLAAWQILLYRQTGQCDIAIGSPIAGRTRSEIQELIGFFVNTLVLRTDLSGQPGFVDLLRRVKKTTLDAYQHQEVPFEKLVEVLQPERRLNRTPFFQVMMALDKERPELRLPGVRLSEFDLGSDATIAKFELALALTEIGSRIQGLLEYSTELFDPSTADRMLNQFLILVLSIVNAPEGRISDLLIMSAAARHELVSEWGSQPVLKSDALTICELVAQQAKLRPQAVAVISEEKQLTYRELNQRANQLARRLRVLGVNPHNRVGIFVEGVIETVVALMGVLKSGAIFVPLEFQETVARLSLMLEDAALVLVITQQHLKDRFPLTIAPMWCLEDKEMLELASGEDMENVAEPESMACMFYRSSSTVKPEAVLIQHRTLVTPEVISGLGAMTFIDRLALEITFTRESGCLQVFRGLCVGACLVSVPNHQPLPPRKLAGLLRDQGITVFWSSARILERVSQEFPSSLDKLRLVVCEDSIDVLQSLTAKLKENVLRKVNGVYGWTETGGLCLVCPLVARAVQHRMGIDRVVLEKKIYLLDDQMEPVPEGVLGEIYVAGSGLATGYHNAPARTAVSFVPDPFSGLVGSRMYRTGDLARRCADCSLEYLGRCDERRIVNGIRIETGEIQGLLAQDTVCEVAIIPRKSGDAETICFVAAEDCSQTGGELQQFLRERLPEMMIPKNFAIVDAIPRMMRGQVDRDALLRKLEEVGATAPRNQTEEQITRIWEQALGSAPIGVHDNFFRLGGHSLLATQVVARVSNIFNVDVPLRSLFEAPTIAEMAETVEHLAKESPARIQTVPAIKRVVREAEFLLTGVK
jgi:amino acid adenylation domain-containing protein